MPPNMQMESKSMAENNNVCLFSGRFCTTALICSLNPRSNILSASSSTVDIEACVKQKNMELSRLLKFKDQMDKQSTLSRFIVQKKMDNTDLRPEEIDEAVVQMIA
uniref:Uncharacterized protein n=1 Tax=Romanomermis culicivorax TaxID=13658 RepID=A0A915KV23_ROMCU